MSRPLTGHEMLHTPVSMSSPERAVDATGPFGGSAAVVVADPHSSKTFLAGTRNALLFRTRDGGESWTPVPFPPELQSTLNALVIDPGTPGVYLAAVSSDSPRYSGILRSTD